MEGRLANRELVSGPQFDGIDPITVHADTITAVQIFKHYSALHEVEAGVLPGYLWIVQDDLTRLLASDNHGVPAQLARVTSGSSPGEKVRCFHVFSQ